MKTFIKCGLQITGFGYSKRTWHRYMSGLSYLYRFRGNGSQHDMSCLCLEGKY